MALSEGLKVGPRGAEKWSAEAEKWSAEGSQRGSKRGRREGSKPSWEGSKPSWEGPFGGPREGLNSTAKSDFSGGNSIKTTPGRGVQTGNFSVRAPPQNGPFGPNPEKRGSRPSVFAKSALSRGGRKVVFFTFFGKVAIRGQKITFRGRIRGNF